MNKTELNALLAQSRYCKKSGPSRLDSAEQKQGGSKSKLMVRDLADVWRKSPVRGTYVPGVRFEAYWRGASLITFNEMLRIDHRMLHSYRVACHEAARNAVIEIARRTFSIAFDRPVKITVYRRDKKMMDLDGLIPSFKFIIDGLRLAKLLKDDDPKHVSDITHDQAVGSPEVGIVVEVI